ncbi:FG-GAP and VCBS repeat-containing protein [Microbispora triticiradicis]|uniref:FG-GAP and VCBS repeat-containing protein n=1 Tax=Microbispora triticiradicis TaxID=2200763 RepID=UPI001AD7894A|nr:FG-GAP and VCBS repeat-containing protein [Microbispora triticiradicis]MBO4270875.1 hypothetical protein [Microbispora triticiradicis]
MDARKIMCTAVSLAFAAGLAATPASAQAAAPALKKFDFNGDGYSDVVVAQPANGGTGAVPVLYGGPGGLKGQVLLRPPGDCSTSAYSCNSFGAQLAAADVDNDGRTDLIAGGRFYAIVSSWTSTGVAQSKHYLGYTPYNGWDAVQVMQAGEFDDRPGADIVKPMRTYYFSSDVLAGWYNGAEQGAYQYLPRAQDGTATAVTSTASGDVNGDGRTELAYVSSENVVELSIMYPPHTSPPQRVLLGSSATCGVVCPKYDSMVHMGDVNGDGHDDLVMVTPSRTSLQVWYGSSSGLSATPGFSTGQLTWLANQAASTSLAVGDVNGDGSAEIAVGAANTTVSGKAGAGMVVVIPGSTGGPVPARAQFVTQDSLGSVPTPASPVADPISERSQSNDNFGDAVSITDVTGDGMGEVVVGVPGKNTNAGMLAVLRGSPTGISATSAQVVHPGTVGVSNPSYFGALLLH